MPKSWRVVGGVGLVTGIAEFIDSFFIGWGAIASLTFSALFFLGLWLTLRRRLLGPILVGVMCVLEIAVFPDSSGQPPSTGCCRSPSSSLVQLVSSLRSSRYFNAVERSHPQRDGQLSTIRPRTHLVHLYASAGRRSSRMRRRAGSSAT